MKIHELQITAKPSRKRVGRGIGSGYGKTAGRGTKGQNARTGGGVRPGFEGGQNPLAKRLPKKRGFTAVSRITYQVINLSNLERLSVSTAGPAEFAASGLVKNPIGRIKLLGSGTISKKLILKVHAVSASAKTALESAGGKLELLEYKAPQSKKKTRPENQEHKR